MDILYFKSNNCGACKRMLPIINDLCEKHDVDLYIYNYEDNKDYFVKYKVQGLPTVIKTDGENEKDRLVGLQPSSKLDMFIGG